jgi:dTDP-4-amino-4,6-dideoxygalactose transaminase
VSEDVGLNVISLPSHPQLTASQIRFICDTLKKRRNR